MFNKNGKSLLYNTGLIISIVVLCCLLLISYYKCYKCYNVNTNTNTLNKPYASNINVNVNSIENKYANNTTHENFENNILTPPKDVRINIKKNDVTIIFTINITNDMPIPKKFIVVLAQYDSNYKNTGNNKIFLSNEYELNMSVSSDEKTHNTNLCTLINGIPSCNYTFNNIDTMDANNKLYYYKIGISAVYDTGNSKFVIPYNINTVNQLFSINTSIEQQNNMLTEFNEFKKTQQTLQQDKEYLYGNTLSTADGQYELIKSQLGNYPSHLIMDPESEKQNSLSDIVDKSMAQGIINIDVI